MALRCATNNNDLEMVKLLLADERTNPYDVLFIASGSGYLEIVKLLLNDYHIDTMPEEFDESMSRATTFGYMDRSKDREDRNSEIVIGRWSG